MQNNQKVILLRDMFVSHNDTLGNRTIVKVASDGDVVDIIGYDPTRGKHWLRKYHDFMGKEGVDFEYAKTSTH